MAAGNPELALPRVNVHLRAPLPVEPVLAGSTVRRAAAGLLFALSFVAGAIILQASALDRVPAPQAPLPPDIRPEVEAAEPWFADGEVFTENIAPAALQPTFRPPRPVARTIPRPAPAITVAGVRVIATAYTSEMSLTDDSPSMTATNTETREGIIALSQDLLRSFTPGAPFDYGDMIEAKGVGRFRVEDTMHPRWQKRADIWLPTRADAMRWGSRSVVLKKVAAEPK